MVSRGQCFLGWALDKASNIFDNMSVSSEHRKDTIVSRPHARLCSPISLLIMAPQNSTVLYSASVHEIYQLRLFHVYLFSQVTSMEQDAKHDVPTKNHLADCVDVTSALEKSYFRLGYVYSHGKILCATSDFDVIPSSSSNEYRRLKAQYNPSLQFSIQFKKRELSSYIGRLPYLLSYPTCYIQIECFRVTLQHIHPHLSNKHHEHHLGDKTFPVYCSAK